MRTIKLLALPRSLGKNKMVRHPPWSRMPSQIPPEEIKDMMGKILAELDISGNKGVEFSDLMDRVGGRGVVSCFWLNIENLTSEGYVNTISLNGDDINRYYTLTPKFHECWDRKIESDEYEKNGRKYETIIVDMFEK